MDKECLLLTLSTQAKVHSATAVDSNKPSSGVPSFSVIRDCADNGLMKINLVEHLLSLYTITVQYSSAAACNRIV